MENGDGPPDCVKICGWKPDELSRKNAQSWEAWSELDRYGRDIDTMSGFPLSLRLADIERTCERYDDPEGIRWRVMQVEETALRYRRDEFQRQRNKK